MKSKCDIGLYIKIKKSDKEKVKKLKTKHCINISQFFRNSINDLYDQLEGGDEEKKIQG